MIRFYKSSDFSDGYFTWSDISHNKANPEVERVTYNPPATILHWSDGTKTVVKTSELDEYSPVMGYLVSYFQKHSGMTKTQFGKLCDKINKEFQEQQDKKGKKVK